MNSRRFKCHAVFSDPNGSYVLFSDHAAELARVEKENALLRAECEAWRAADLRHDWIRDNTAGGVAATHEVDCLICKMNATDAANILRGAE